MKKLPFSVALLGCMLIFVAAFGAPAFASTDSGEVPPGWAVWSCWYWPYNDEDYLNPNLYDTYEAMWQYDKYDSGAQSQAWEYDNHGPPQGQPDWAGHCHAWSGAACWEDQPTTSRTLNGIEFWVRDRKGLLCEMYFNCTTNDVSDFSRYHPTPGEFWYWLRREIKGINSMHGHGMAFIGELSYGPEVWNYPIYKYSVTYSYSGNQIYGTMDIYGAADGLPSYADDIGLHSVTPPYHYTFSGVTLDGSGEPSDSGTWGGSGPSHAPDSIWRPVYADTWLKYVANTGLDASHLAAILNPPPVPVKGKGLGGVLELLLLR